MKNLFLFLSIGIACGVMLVNVYTSLIDARSWGSHIPDSIGVAREYFRSVNPGNFFRIFSPLNQLLGLVAVILFWKSDPSVRLYLCIAFAMYLVAEALTFKFFYPRNDIMFRDAALTDIRLLKKVWSEWNMVNWIRTLVLLIGVSFSCYSLHKIYTHAAV
jgi:uncharacterized membrane protein